MSQAYSLAVQAALGNRFARILLAAQQYREEKRAAREARSLASLFRAHRFRTPGFPTNDDQTQGGQEGRSEEGPGQEGAGQDGQA